MEFLHNTNEITIQNENGEVIALVAFPEESENVVTVNRTFVSDVLRGQGIAGKLMGELVKNLKETNRKANPTCSYAVSWFEKHPEFQDLLSK
ncbi:MAG: GNAT family N-acetyltransferase [Bacillota bacterium]